ncbi:Lysine-specific demethylase 7A [Trichinella pseudospiralis]
MDNPTTAIPSKEPMTTTGANKKFPIKLAWLLSIFTLETILKDTKNLISKVEEQDVEERKDSTDETQVNADDQMLEENDIWKQIIEHLSKSHTTLLKPIEMKLIMNNFKFESKYDLMEKISKVCKAILSDYEFNSLLLLCYHLREVLNFCSKPNELLDEIIAKWAMFISKYMEECFENRFHNEINFTSKIVAITNERIGIFEKELKDEIQNREKYQRQRVIILNVKAVCSYKRKELQQPQQFDVNDKINKSHYVGYVQRMVRLYEELNQKPHQRFK